MERIKQALERARAEQAQSGGAAPAAPRAPAAGIETSPADAPITYSQTKVLPVSEAVLKKHRVITGMEQDVITASYKMLRTQVLQRLTAKNWNALAITSPGPAAGKTLTAINLAISLAREVTNTVLLVDLDLRRPSVHRYLGLTPEKGIGDYLMHETPISDVLINPGIERLVLLPGREPLLNSSEMLRSPRMVRLVEELKTRYPSRIVLFDLPPLLATDDALAFAPYVDAALLVLEEGKTTQDELVSAMNLLQGTSVIGTVLNKSEEKPSGYYY